MGMHTYLDKKVMMAPYVVMLKKGVISQEEFNAIDAICIDGKAEYYVGAELETYVLSMSEKEEARGMERSIR